MADRLDEAQIASRLTGSAWARDGEQIVRDWQLADFAQAIAFVNQVAEVAEAADHHPDILVHDYRRVRLTLTTHSAGGLTERDLAMAARLDALTPGA